MSSYLHVLNGLCEKVQKSMANKTNDDIEWDVGVEILLFYAMIGHKPVGMNRYFMMASIHDKFSNYINRQITSKPIWNHLDTMYDMAALHESEIIPFPNEEVEFELPAEDFDEIAIERLGVAPTHAHPNPDSSTPNTKARGKQSISKPKQVSSSSPKATDLLFRKPLPQTTPVSVKLNRNSLPESKNGEKGASSPANKTDKGKVKQPELLMHAEVKVEAASQSQLKKALKLDRTSEDKDKKVQESTRSLKVSESSSESSTKSNTPCEEDKAHTKTETNEKDKILFKVPAVPPLRPVKKTTASSQKSIVPGKMLKYGKHEPLDKNKKKRKKSTDSKKSEPVAKKQRT